MKACCTACIEAHTGLQLALCAFPKQEICYYLSVSVCLLCVAFLSGLYEGHPSLQVVRPVDWARTEVWTSSISCECFYVKNMNVQCGTCVCVCLDSRFAFQYNPSLQPRALVVFGCISKRVSHGQIKQIIRILSKASPLLSIDRVRAHIHSVKPMLWPANITCVSVH